VVAEGGVDGDFFLWGNRLRAPHDPPSAYIVGKNSNAPDAYKTGRRDKLGVTSDAPKYVA
jgi:hypothetical protein